MGNHYKFLTILKHNFLIRFLLFLSINIVFHVSIYSQDFEKNQIDSLKQVLVKVDVKNIDKINSRLELSKIFLHENLDSAIFHIERGKLLAEKSSNKRMIVKCLIQLARIKEVQNEIYGSLEYLNEAEKYYEGIDKDNIYMTVCNYQGMYYDVLSNYDMSIEKYLIGLKLARDLNDRGYEAVFLSNLSIVYPKANQFEESLSSSIEALAILNEIGSRSQYYHTKIFVGNSYFNLGKYEFSKEHLNNAKEYFEKSNDHILLSDIYLTLANISMNTKNQEEALELYLIAQYHAMKMKDYNGDQNYKLALANNSLGNVYLYFKDFSKAIQLFRSSVKIGKKLKSNQVLKGSYKGLYSSYLGLRELDSVTYYLGLFIPVNDSLAAEKYNEKINTLNYDYKLENEKQKFEQQKKQIIFQKKNQKVFFISILSMLALVILMITFSWYVMKTKYQKSHLIKLNLELEKSNWTKELERKKKELTSSLLNLIERNKFISTVSERLKESKSDDSELALNKIESLIKNIDRNSNKNIWKEFELRYTEVHNDFFVKLNNIASNLTANERRLSALIVLNMSTKEISSITYQSPQSIKVARYRLRKKLGLYKNENLTLFLNKL